MRAGLLSELAAIGYEIFLRGDNIRLRYQKKDSPPESVRPLIEELKQHKAEVVNILRMGRTASSDEVTQSQSTKAVSWPPEYQSLVDWFMILDTPKAPFYLDAHRHVVDPVKFFSALQKDIEEGPNGPRGRHGIVIQDLTTIKKILH